MYQSQSHLHHPVSHLRDAALADSRLRLVCGLGRGVVFAVGEQALVIKSEGGVGNRAWQAQAVPVASRYSLAACSFMNATHGWAVGRYGTILATVDGGGVWLLRGVGLDSTLNLHDVAQQPVQRTDWGQPIGYTGVVLAVGSGGVILRSLDYGVVWAAVNSLSTGNLNAVTWATPTVACWCVLNTLVASPSELLASPSELVSPASS